MSDLLAQRIGALPPEALALLWRWAHSGNAAAEGSIRPRERKTVAPLSFAQERLWFVEQLHPGSAAYNLPLVLPMNESLDVGVLQRAVSEVVRRHESLRTAFVVSSGVPMQYVAPAAEVPVEVVEAQVADVPALLAERIARPFDLERLPLLRVHVITAGDARYVVINTHHIISDGWSLVVLLRELSTLYRAYSEGVPSSLPSLPIQYADYAMWQRDRLTGDALASLLAFWREHLEGTPLHADMPLDRPRRALESRRGAAFTMVIPGELATRIEHTARTHEATVFMLLLAAFQGLFARWCAQDAVVVGSPVANRTRAEVEPLIGFFVNLLPLAARVRRNPSFAALLARVRDATIDAYGHQELPFEKLVEELAPRRSLSFEPIFQAVFALENPQDESSGADAVPSADPTPIPLTAKFDLSFSLRQTGGLIAGRVEYRSDLFDHDTIERLARRYVALLDAVTSDDRLRFSEWPLLLDDERPLLASLDDGTAARPLARQLGFNAGSRIALAGTSPMMTTIRAAARAAGAKLVTADATHLCATPSALARLRPADHPELRELFILGAPCLPRTLRAWIGRVRVRALWGKPACGIVLMTDVERAVTSIEGTPLAGVRLRVTDARGQDRPPGAWGYLNLSTPATRRRGDGMLRTREIARIRANGIVQLRGAARRLVRPNGTPADPLLLEELLRQHSAIADAAAVMTGAELVAVVETVPGRTLVAADVVAFAREELPDLLPARVVPAPLPRLASGRVDRAALPALVKAAADETAGGDAAPRTPVEAVLARIWSEVLQVPGLGVRTNFFDAGGNSITSVQVIARVRESFRVELPLHRLFEVPTIEELAAAIAVEAPAYEPSAELRAEPVRGIDLRQLDPHDIPDFVESLDDWEVQMLLEDCLREESPS